MTSFDIEMPFVDTARRERHVPQVLLPQGGISGKNSARQIQAERPGGHSARWRRAFVA